MIDDDDHEQNDNDDDEDIRPSARGSESVVAAIRPSSSSLSIFSSSTSSRFNDDDVRIDRVQVGAIDDVPPTATHVEIVNRSLVVIPPNAFGTNLRGLVLPRGLRHIERHAFRNCISLEHAMLPHTVNRIETDAFRDTSLTNFRVPSCMTIFDVGMFGGRDNSVFSIEISPIGVRRVSCESSDALPPNHLGWTNWTELCHLRNVAFPPESEVDPRAMTCMTGLKGALFPNDNVYDSMYSADALSHAIDAIRNRFVGLPIHAVCYGQCYQTDVDAVMRDLRREINPWSSSSSSSRSGAGGPMFLGRLNATGRTRDCLGMTPLHILTCSSRHDIDMYRLLVSKYPENLVTRDGWGDVPLLYAFWSDAPRNVMGYLVECYGAMHPEHAIDWMGMVRTLAEGRSPPSRLRNLLDVRSRCVRSSVDDDRASSSSYSSSWRDELRDVVSDLAIAHDLRSSTFRRPRTSITTFRYLLHEVLSYRIEACRVGRWRSELIRPLEGYVESANDWESRTNTVYAMLETCVSIRESAAILELALWKARMMGREGDNDVGGQRRCRAKKWRRLNDGTEHGRRERCRINSGADVVVRNVLPYLWTGVCMGGGKGRGGDAIAASV